MFKNKILRIAVFMVACMLFLASCGILDDNNEITTEITPDGTILRGSTLAAKLNWLDENAESHGTYILEVNKYQNISPHTFDYGDRDSIIVILKGVEENRNIRGLSLGNLFTINSGVTFVLGDNITLVGQHRNSDYLVIVNGGTFIMNIGSNITGNGQSAVYIDNGTFEMTGGNISDNVVNTNIVNIGGGGVLVGNGAFNMSGGTISGNIAEHGGGVFVYRNGTFNMQAGNITGNIAREYGGGVFIWRGIFNKTGGTITGFASDQINGNVVIDVWGNDLVRRGHAVYLDNLSPRHKETTLTPADSLSSSNVYGWDN